MNPELVNTETYSKDVRARAKYYLERMGSTTIGAYSDSAGHIFVRESVAKYIAKRDNHLIPPGIYFKFFIFGSPFYFLFNLFTIRQIYP